MRRGQCAVKSSGTVVPAQLCASQSRCVGESPRLRFNSFLFCNLLVDRQALRERMSTGRELHHERSGLEATALSLV